MSGQGTSSGFDEPALGFDASSFVFAPPVPAAPSAREVLRRRFVFAVVLVAHALALALLIAFGRGVEPAPSPGLRVEFISIPATQSPPPPSPAPVQPHRAQPRRATPSSATPPSPRRSSALQAVDVPARAAEPAETTPAPATSAQLFDDEGHIVLPEGAFEALQENISDDRVFDYQIAGLSQAKTAFDRRAPLVYEPSRFEAGMRPTQDMLTEVLSRAVAASTLSISIPIPGDPYRRIECKVVVLAMGGGCGMTGFTGYVEEDDPDTLNDEEEAQCAAWWEKITTTGQQGEWRATRALYDANCRKPRETRPGPPPKPG